MERNPLAMKELQETWAQSLGRDDSLQERMATHSSVLAWRIPWTEGWTENPKDRAWRATAYSVAKSPTRLSTHARTHARWELRSCKLCSPSKKKRHHPCPPLFPLLLHVSKSWSLSLQNMTHITHLSNTGPSHFPRLSGQLDSSPCLTLGPFGLATLHQPK